MSSIDGTRADVPTKQPATTWVDLTDIATWSGQHGGTQRVTYAIAEQYAAHPQDGPVRYCVYDTGLRRYRPYDFQVLRDRVAAFNTAAAQTGAGSSPSLQQQVKQAVAERIPMSVRTDPRFRAGLAKTRGGVRRVRSAGAELGQARARLTRRRTTSPTGDDVVFAPGDTLLLVGKPWDYPTMMEDVEALRHRHGIRVAAVLYDLIIPLHPHLHATELFPAYTRFAFELAQTADVVLPISQSSARDYEKFCATLNLPCPPQHVIRLGDELDQVTGPVRPDGGVRDDYLLCVGTIEVRKNHALLYQAYKLAAEQGVDLPQLVIVGKPGWYAGDTYRLFKTDPAVRDRVVILEATTDPELAWLYENCLFAVYPSAYEGWGLPVAEAMRYGKLTAASRSSSIPEIAGDLIPYFSPYSAQECLDAMVPLLDPAVRAAREERLRADAPMTTWAQTYRAVRDRIG